MPSARVGRQAAAIVVAAVTCAVAPAPARAQNICANFFPIVTRQLPGAFYADRLEAVLTPSPTVTATAYGITGAHLASSAGMQCSRYELSQVVARLDFWVMRVDPGEEVWFVMNGVERVLDPSDLLRNPDVSTQPLSIANGRLYSMTADGSAYVELGQPGLDEFEICASSGGGTGGVIVQVIINSFCQCANGNRHFNEDCDDGNTTSGDGCSMTCATEVGWDCNGPPQMISVCVEETPDAAVPDADIYDAEVPDALVPDAEVPDAAAIVPDAAPGAPDAATSSPDARAPADAGDDHRELQGCSCRGGDAGGTLLGALAVTLLAIAPRRRRPD